MGGSGGLARAAAAAVAAIAVVAAPLLLGSRARIGAGRPAGRLGMEAVGGRDGNLGADQLLDAAQEIALAGRAERNGVAAGAGAGGAADAVDVTSGSTGRS